MIATRRTLRSASTLMLILLFATMGWATVRTVRAIDTHSGWQGSLDFYPYWLASLEVRQGQDPYEAALAEDAPDTPIKHLDGRTTRTEDFAVNPDGSLIPGGRVTTNPAILTAPIMVATYPFAFLSWPTAKYVMLLINMICVALMPWAAWRIRARRHERPQETYWLLLLGAAFVGLYGTGTALALGQLAIVSLLLGLVSIRLSNDGNTVLAGLAVGLALSKPHFALPFFLFLLLKRSWVPAAVAVGVQAAGFTILGMLVGKPPWAVVESWLRLLDHRAVTGGRGRRIEIQSFFLGSDAWIGRMMIFMLSIVVLAWLVRLIRIHTWARWVEGDHESDLAVLALLAGWTLLTTRHIDYDMILLILPITVLVLFSASTRRFSGEAVAGMILMGLAFVPGRAIEVALTLDSQDTWLTTFRALEALTVLGFTVLTAHIAGALLPGRDSGTALGDNPAEQVLGSKS